MKIFGLGLAATAAACMLTVSVTAGNAVTVNFENEFPLTPDPTSVGTSYSNGGITFSSGETMILSQVGGNPVSGFVPSDSPSPGGAFGNIFLGGDFNGNTDMMLTFGGGTMSSISFGLADIDGNGGQTETFVVELSLLGSAIFSQTFVSGDAGTGNAAITPFSFTGGSFDKVSIVGTTVGEVRNIGWGIDNITAVPIPAALPLLGTGIAALGFLGWRRKRYSA